MISTIFFGNFPNRCLMQKMNNGLSILTIEDNPSDLFLVEHMLRSSSLEIGNLYSIDRIVQATGMLQSHAIDLVLLELTLPDSFGINSFIHLLPVVQKIPVIILTGLSDTSLALEAIKEGAQDYLVKGEFNENLLAKSIQYSLERKRNLENLRESNERFNTVVKATNDAIWDWDLLTNEVFLVGDTYKQLFGYDIVNAISPLDIRESIMQQQEKKKVIENIQRIITEENINNTDAQYRLN